VIESCHPQADKQKPYQKKHGEACPLTLVEDDEGHHRDLEARVSDSDAPPAQVVVLLGAVRSETNLS